MLLHKTILNNPSQRSLCLFFFFFSFSGLKPYLLLYGWHQYIWNVSSFYKVPQEFPEKKKNTGLSQKCCVTRIKDWALQYSQTSTHMQSTFKKVRKWTNENVLILLSYMRRVTFSAPPPGFLSKKVFAQLLSVLFVTCLVSSTWASQVDTDIAHHNGDITATCSSQKRDPLQVCNPA